MTPSRAIGLAACFTSSTTKLSSLTGIRGVALGRPEQLSLTDVVDQHLHPDHGVGHHVARAVGRVPPVREYGTPAPVRPRPPMYVGGT